MAMNQKNLREDLSQQPNRIRQRGDYPRLPLPRPFQPQSFMP